MILVKVALWGATQDLGAGTAPGDSCDIYRNGCIIEILLVDFSLLTDLYSLCGFSEYSLV